MKYLPPRFVGIVAVICAFFALTHVSDARGARGGGKKQPPPKVPYTAIISVDQTAMTITVGPKNSTATGSKTYKFTAKTKITANGQAGTMAQLTPGQQIHVGAGMDPDVAEELTVTAPPADPTYGGAQKQ